MNKALLFIGVNIVSFLYADSILFLPNLSQDDKAYNNNDKILSQIKSEDSALQDNQISNSSQSISHTQKNSKDLMQYSSNKSNDSSKESDFIYTTPTQQNNIIAQKQDMQKSQESRDSALTTNITKKQSPKQQLYTIANGATLILTTSKPHPKNFQIGPKTIYWLPHPTNSSKKIAFLPIPYRTKFGIRQISDTISLNIQEGNYRKENIVITNSNKIKPNEKENKQIARELKEANKIYTTYTTKRYWNKPFIYPLSSTITSPFGSARVFNGEVKSFHSGTDFRAKIGTPIAASNDGIVVIAKERFLAGKSVVISHGEGVFSMYYHCSDIKVNLGQKVKRGDIIALSGDTGRVSGPHLHFAMFVNGIQVDPMDFIKKINALF